jgi:hypothetical protein
MKKEKNGNKVKAGDKKLGSDRTLCLNDDVHDKQTEHTISNLGKGLKEYTSHISCL